MRFLTLIAVVYLVSAVGIAAYLVSAYRHDKAVDRQVIAEAERILEQAAR